MAATFSKREMQPLTFRFLRDAAHEHPDQLAEPAHEKLPDVARERIKQRLRAEEE